MAGYASRTNPSEGKLHDLWAKALILEDAQGEKAVLVTMDILGVPKLISEEIRNQLQQKFNLQKSQINLNSSHTHSGPVLENALTGIYPLEEEHLNEISTYSRHFITRIVTLVENALADRKPVRLYAANGVTRFQVNRRNNSEASLAQQTELRGPHDYAVPVMKVESMTGELLAVTFGYACHNTVLDINKWSGDYAGFAQLELERQYPGVTALFFQGASGDLNPLPRRTVPLAKQYGRTLAAAVSRVLDEDMRQLSPVLSTAYSEITLHLTDLPVEQDLLKIVETSTSFEGRCAEALLKRLKSGEAFSLTYDYPVQFWVLGDQSIVSLGGEAVVEYAIELKKVLGDSLFVMAYSNDVMGYIPSNIILREGGYEGDSSQMVYGLPSKWKEGIQERIIGEVLKLAKEINAASGIQVF